MSELVLHPTSVAQWHSLLGEAQDSCDVRLHEDLESYLVFLLSRFLRQPRLASVVVGRRFLECTELSGASREMHMQVLGDQCLLYSGLFPKRAHRKRVPVGYFVSIGRSAFHDLGTAARRETADLFARVSESFVPMMDVLQSTRGLSGGAVLDPLAALELWTDTGSRSALNALQADAGNDTIIT